MKRYQEHYDDIISGKIEIKIALPDTPEIKRKRRPCRVVQHEDGGYEVIYLDNVNETTI